LPPPEHARRPHCGLGRDILLQIASISHRLGSIEAGDAVNERLSREEIYDASLDDDALRALPVRLADRFGARSCLIQWVTEDGRSTILSQNGYFPEDMLAEYGAHWAPLDPWMQASQRWQPPNEAMNLEELVPVSDFCRSEFYNELLRPGGDDSCRGIGVRVHNRYGSGFIALQRGRTQNAFEADAVEALQASAAHLRRMLAMRGRLVSTAVTATAVTAMMDALGTAMLLVSATGRLLHANTAGTEVIARSGALALRQSLLIGTSAQGERLLRQLIARALAPATPTAGAAAFTCPDGRRLELTALAVAAEAGCRHVLLAGPNCWTRDPSLAERMRALYNLSPAESVLAVALAEGASPAQVAEERGVALATVRTQIKNIAAKLGCNRQSDIVAKVKNLPVLKSR
jgi:DNA-binding CsgD family transcriptional regulator